MSNLALKFVSTAEPHYTKSGHRLLTVIVQCKCGKQFKILKGNLAKRPNTTCGCGKFDNRKDIHGFRGTPLYRRWDAMIQRCHNEKSYAYHNYGGRGISVCQEWRTFLNFKAWADSSGFEIHLELDRIINDGNYEPSNCRWVTHSQNNRNKRDNHLLTFNGETKTIVEWSESTGLTANCILGRIKLLKWSVERALTTKSKRHAQV